MRVWPGSPYPQGATWDGEGVNFSVGDKCRIAEHLALGYFDYRHSCITSSTKLAHRWTHLILWV